MSNMANRPVFVPDFVSRDMILAVEMNDFAARSAILSLEAPISKSPDLARNMQRAPISKDEFVRTVPVKPGAPLHVGDAHQATLAFG